MDNAKMKNEKSKEDRFGIAERTRRMFGDVTEYRPGGMKIFLSARYGRGEELRGYAKELAAQGHTVISTCFARTKLMTRTYLLLRPGAGTFRPDADRSIRHFYCLYRGAR